MSEPVFPEAGPSSSPDRPSLFELLADEQLRDLFHPVIRYVLSVRPSFRLYSVSTVNRTSTGGEGLMGFSTSLRSILGT